MVAMVVIIIAVVCGSLVWIVLIGTVVIVSAFCVRVATVGGLPELDVLVHAETRSSPIIKRMRTITFFIFICYNIHYR